MRKTILFAALCMSILIARAETRPSLVVVPITGTEQMTALAHIGRLVIEDDKVYLYDKNLHVLATYSTSSIKRIQFAGVESNTPVSETNADVIRIYPNPTQDALIVEGEDMGNMYIYDLQGNLMLTHTATERVNTIDVTSLPQGTYLILMNAQTVKFIKQ